MSQAFPRHVHKQLQGKADLIQKVQRQGCGNLGRERSFHMAQLGVIYQEGVNFTWPLRGSN